MRDLRLIDEIINFGGCGDYIREQKNPSHSIGAQPLGNGFTGIEYLYDKNITFPDYFPAVRDMRAADNKLFVITYKTKNQQSECFIFDIKGKFIKQLFLPLKEVDLDHYPFDIRYGKVYQLIENLDKEEWDLHITDIK